MTIYLPGNVPLDLVRIPAGTFQMGSPDTEFSRESDEGPVHMITISHDFYLGKTEVTQRQWLAVMGSWPSSTIANNPNSHEGLGDNYPAYYVSWDDITGTNGFIQKLNAHLQHTDQGVEVRLPSEAEWEYACRAETTTRFFFGNSLSVGPLGGEEDDEDGPTGSATYPGNRSDYMWFIFQCGGNAFGSRPVGTKLPNAWGLYDMSGNVGEWCQDWYGSYGSGAQIDPTGPDSGSYRVKRGGHWRSVARYCRSAFRKTYARPGERIAYTGFRLARTNPKNNDGLGGSLQISIYPSGAVASGAQWRRVGTIPWFDAGATESDVPTGKWSIEFKDLPDWNTVPNLTGITIVKDQLFTAAATYHQGSLKVMLSPTEAAASGAQWRRAGTSVWLDSGATETEIPFGIYPLEFKDVTGWIRPQSQSITIIKNQTPTATATAEYRPGSGLIWSSYIGVGGTDEARAVTLDAAGNVYVTGSTSSPGWVSGGYDTSFNGTRDIFVARLSPIGALQWSTYLGGTGDDEGLALTIDKEGFSQPHLYVTGRTRSSGWVFGFSPSYNGGDDAFLVKLFLDGTYQSAGYYGGANDDWGTGIYAKRGIIFLIGNTKTSGWISGGYDPSYNGRTDGFLMQIGGGHWSTYIGGNGDDFITGIAVNSDRNIYITGTTTSAGWVAGGYDASFGGGADAFVMMVTSGGTHTWSSYLGGAGNDEATGIGINKSGDVLIAGLTTSRGWTAGGFDVSQNGGSDAFVAKLGPWGAHLWSTYLGGGGDDAGQGIAVNGADDVFVTGWTKSPGWATGHADASINGGLDAFLVKLATGGARAWTTYLGGNSYDIGYGVAVGGAGDVYVAGRTKSVGWTAGGFDTSYGGAADGFLVKVNDSGALQVTLGPPAAVVAGARWRPVGTPDWLESGTTFSGLPSGQYTIEFTDAAGWIKLANITATTDMNATTSLGVTYRRQTSIDPALWSLYQ